MQSAARSAAPIGDMMIIVGDDLLGQGHGKYFMLAEAFTVFLALIGTTLSCMNTGARVTYAMGKDDEAPEHFGMLHAKSLSPRRAIWTLASSPPSSACVAVSLVFADASALPPMRPSPRCRTTSSRVSVICRTTRLPSCRTRFLPSPSPPTSAPSSFTV